MDNTSFISRARASVKQVLGTRKPANVASYCHFLSWTVSLQTVSLEIIIQWQRSVFDAVPDKSANKNISYMAESIKAEKLAQHINNVKLLSKAINFSSKCFGKKKKISSKCKTNAVQSIPVKVKSYVRQQHKQKLLERQELISSYQYHAYRHPSILVRKKVHPRIYYFQLWFHPWFGPALQPQSFPCIFVVENRILWVPLLIFFKL